MTQETTSENPSSEGEDEPEEGKLIPAPPGEQGDASFVAKLQRTFGPEVDPEISLQADESAPGETDSGEGEAKEPGSSETETEGLFLKLSEKDPHSVRYRVKGELARGGMGAILRVWDDDLRRNLAMKVLLSRRGSDELSDGPQEIDQELLSRFLEEAQITGQLDHPGIVPVHDLGIDAQGRVYFTMRLVRGRDLKGILDLLAEGKEGWSQTKALHVVLKVCEAMAFAHSKGVVHRDLKPANIMVGRFGETYVMDWGLARVLGRRDSHDMRLKPADASALSLVRTARHADHAEDPKSPLITMDGDVIGTPSYMSPEQAEGRLDDVGPRSDVYSLGAILYQMLSGQAPYVKPGSQLSPHTVLMAAIEGPPTPVDQINPELPGELVAICTKAMARDPEARYPTMLEMAADIEAFLEGRVVSAYEAGALAEGRKWMQRNRGLAASIALAAMLGVGGIAGVLTIQITKAQELKDANTSLKVAMKSAADKEADANEATKQATDALAEVQEARAQEAERAKEAQQHLLVAQTRNYMSDIRAAEYTLRLRQVGETLNLLERCDQELRDWEWEHLALRCQSQIGQPAYPSTPIERVILGDRGRVLVMVENGLLGVYQSGAAGLTGDQVLSKWVWPPSTPDAVDFALDPTGELAAVIGRKAGHVVLLSARGYSNAGRDDAQALFLPDEMDEGDGGWLPAKGADISELADGEPRCLAFGASDDLLAVGYDNGVVGLWDHVARELYHTFHVRAEVTSVAFDADGVRLAVGSRDGNVRVYDVHALREEIALAAHEGPVLTLAFDPKEGGLLATGGEDGRVRIWSALNGAQVARHAAHTAAVRALAFYPNGRALVSGGDDTTLQVWDLTEAAARTGGGEITSDTAESREIRTLIGHDGPVADIAISPDGAIVYSGGRDGSLRSWDPEFAGPVTELIDGRFTGPDADVRLAQLTAVDFHPDGWTCLTGHADGSVAIWDSLGGELMYILRGHKRAVTDVEFGPGGTRILSASVDKTAILWDVANRAAIETFKHGVNDQETVINAAAISPDGRYVITAGIDDVARVFNAQTGEMLDELEHDGWVNAVVISPDGSEVWTGSRDGKLRLWSTVTGSLLAQLGGEVEVASLALSDDGSMLAAGLGDGQMILLDIPAWRAERGTGSGPEADPVEGEGSWLSLIDATASGDPVTALAFNHSGTRLIAGSIDGALRVYHTRTGDRLLTLRGHAGAICGIAFSADDARLFSGSAILGQSNSYVAAGESVARIWETAGTSERRTARRDATRLRREASVVVDRLFDTLFLQEAVVENIPRNSLLTVEQRPVALRLALLRMDDPDRLAEQSWVVARRTDVTPEAASLARRRAEAATGIEAASVFCLAVLGATQVRDPDVSAAAALASLERIDRRAKGRMDPRVAAIRDGFSALAHDELGHTDEAHASFGAFLAGAQANAPEFRMLRTELVGRFGDPAVEAGDGNGKGLEAAAPESAADPASSGQ